MDIIGAFYYFHLLSIFLSPSPLIRSCSPLMVRKKIGHCPPAGDDDELRGASLKAERPAGKVSLEPKRHIPSGLRLDQGEGCERRMMLRY